MANQIKTVIHAYSYDIRRVEDAKAWRELQYKMSELGVSVLHALGSYYLPALDNAVVTLETEPLFDNQWNTAPVEGVPYRLFNWAQETIPNCDIKRGYWLEQTPEMIEIRASRILYV